MEPTIILRDRIFVDETRAPVIFERLLKVGIGQVVIISTCDRVEVLGTHLEPLDAIQEICNVFRSIVGGSSVELLDQLYVLHDEDAVRHIFAVATSLDSQMIGETQILSQLKKSHRLAREYNMVGSVLEGIMQSAYGVSKRIRSETQIGEGPVSLAASALKIARNVHGDLDVCTGLVVGLGDMGEFIGGHLRSAGLGRTIMAGPSRRTEVVARRMGWHFVAMEELADALVEADIVITASGTGRYVITKENIYKTLKSRRHRPMLLFDGAVPGDVEPAAGHLEEVFLYTLEDLESVALAGRSSRASAAKKAWLIIGDEIENWRRRQTEQDAVPALVALRGYFEEVREEVLATNPHSDSAEVTRILVNRLLHHPSYALRELAISADMRGNDSGVKIEQIIRRVFNLSERGVEE